VITKDVKTNSQKSSIDALLDLVVNNKASDLHLVVGYSPVLRINGQLYSIASQPTITREKIDELLSPILGDRKQRFLKEKELDFSYSFGKKGEFRVNVYYQQGAPAASFRFIRSAISSLDELNLPSSLKSLASWRQGFVLVTGPTGHGKSTTVAALLEEINATRASHIITIEDPIEYRFLPKKSLISQREIEQDTLSWTRALRSVLREDPDVVFIGEMRDLETISAALTIAETGHLVFSTLHTNSAAETIDRIVDVFPPSDKENIRFQLANVLGAVISQRLVPTIKPGRVPAVEILYSSTAVKTAIREKKTHMIDNIIQTSSELGMMSLEESLASWVKKGVVSREVAEGYALRKRDFVRNLK
jgi:twitching motility protein PilT